MKRITFLLFDLAVLAVGFTPGSTNIGFFASLSSSTDPSSPQWRSPVSRGRRPAADKDTAIGEENESPHPPDSPPPDSALAPKNPFFLNQPTDTEKVEAADWVESSFSSMEGGLDDEELRFTKKASAAPLSSSEEKADMAAQNSKIIVQKAAKAVEPIFLAQVQHDVPQQAIKGALVLGAVAAALAGKGVALTGAASIGTAYLAITTGPIGNLMRNVGNLAWNVGTGAVQAYKAAEETAAARAVRLANLRAQRVVEAKQKLELKQRSLLAARIQVDLKTRQQRARQKLADQQRLAEEAIQLEEEAANLQQRLAEVARRKDQARQAEAKQRKELEDQERLAAEVRKTEEARQGRLAEQARMRAEEKRLAVQAREAEKRRLEEEQRRVEDARLAEEARIAEIARKEEEARMAEIAKKAEEARKAELARKLEETRLADLARRKERARVAEEKRREEQAQARLAEIARKEEEARLAEVARKEDEARLAAIAEQARLADVARKAEEAKLAEIAKAAEKNRMAKEAKPAEKTPKAGKTSRGMDEEDWNASIQAAQGSIDANIVGLKDAFVDDKEKTAWAAAKQAAKSGVGKKNAPAEEDSEDEEMDMDALAAQARAAVENYEKQTGGGGGEKNEDKQSWVGETGDTTSEIGGTWVDEDGYEYEYVWEEVDEDSEYAEEDERRAEYTAGSVGTPMIDWSSYKVSDLKLELEKRGLRTTGKKGDLVAMLEQSDLELLILNGVDDDSDDITVSFDELKSMEAMNAYIDSADEPTDEDLRRIEQGGAASYGDLDFESMTIPALKEELRTRGLRLSGKKSDLVTRLQSYEARL